MSALSDSAENRMLDWILNVGSPTRPSGTWVALFTSATNDAGGGTEVTGNGYARQTVTFATASAGATSNTDAPSFTASGGSFGTITHVAITDAASGGNFLYHGSMTTSKTIADGETLEFAIGDIDLTLD